MPKRLINFIFFILATPVYCADKVSAPTVDSSYSNIKKETVIRDEQKSTKEADLRDLMLKASNSKQNVFIVVNANQPYETAKNSLETGGNLFLLIDLVKSDPQ
tara:strand:- start:183 stop:491 length:309 start_codon:yes stop_codon:yes gene_type:complete